MNNRDSTIDFDVTGATVRECRTKAEEQIKHALGLDQIPVTLHWTMNVEPTFNVVSDEGIRPVAQWTAHVHVWNFA